jgi:hypothetical protein
MNSSPLISFFSDLGKFMGNTIFSNFQIEFLLAIRSSSLLVFFRGLSIRVSNALRVLSNSNMSRLIKLLNIFRLNVFF